MIKKIILGMVIVVVIAAAAGGYAIYSFFPEDDYMARFAIENPDKSAFLLIRNDTVIGQQNLHQEMPLASTVKFIIAVEFAEQVGKGWILPEENIAKKELLNFYVPNTDGGAHNNWSDSDDILQYGDSIPLISIAKGMMQYSSNANSEWLMERLGLENINNQLAKLDFKDHTPIYPFVSSLFITEEYFKDKTEDELVDAIKNISEEQYINYALDIHQKMLQDPEYRNQQLDLNETMQGIWSDRLPAGSVSDYVSLMKKLNSKTYYDEKTQTVLNEIIETSMRYNSTKEFYQHIGIKGGSTLFIMTKALYAEDHKGNKTEMAYFFNGLEAQERKKMTMSINDFDRTVLRNPMMVQKIKKLFSTYE
ncbi:serine hydrolase [Nonlabens sp. Ci31]|uniref:serine hydrolase n=1 Tax=Nonlabens sp. Ci31 TaxID=2608253 RepID=UPI0014647CD4|nr:serine hydrolase [Nonlabens sp. Ci31]QJP35299.1 serine hydrolase [Nonlabens sp. Ci31]